MKTVLYVNHGLATRCGVYDFGVRHFASLKGSNIYNFVYAECNSFEEYTETYNLHHPDAVFINYMRLVLPWVDDSIRLLPAKRFVVQHLYDSTSVHQIMRSYGGLFDYMICLDPSLESSGNVFSLGRPIPQFTVARNPLEGEIQIGSFGFALPHKQFPIIMREVNRCFDSAVLNLHMTEGDFTGSYTEAIINSCLSEINKPGIRLNHTSDYRDEMNIVEMLSNNHMNALFYALPPDNAGLSSSIDYMIAAQRPILVTDCGSFNHVYDGTFQYPTVSFDTIAGNYEWCQNHAYALYERSVGRLLTDTETMLEATI